MVMALSFDPIVFQAIGVIRSEHTKPGETPIQPVFARGCAGCVEVFPEFAGGLRDLEGFSHIHLLYFLHRAGPAQLLAKPFLQDVERGVFSTRFPRRPNPIGLSVVRLIRLEENVLFIENVDILDGTPLLDIKPYNAHFDRVDPERNGWYEEVDAADAAIRGRQGYRGAPASAGNASGTGNPTVEAGAGGDSESGS